MSNLVVQDLLDGYDNPVWHGHGYLGERRHALDSTDPECPAQPDTVAAADEWIVNRANELGWSREDLFEWADSKYGRWYGDLWFGGGTGERLVRESGELARLP